MPTQNSTLVERAMNMVRASHLDFRTPTQPARNDEFYVVRFCTRLDQLAQNDQVYYGDTSLTVASLNVKEEYSLRWMRFESGATKGQVVSSIE